MRYWRVPAIRKESYELNENNLRPFPPNTQCNVTFCVDVPLWMAAHCAKPALSESSKLSPDNPGAGRGKDHG
jgi:hypothetical protein